MGWHSGYEWRPYVSVAERRREAAKTIDKMKKAGRTVTPVEIAGRKITTTFWGDAWCQNLEAYSDFANRLPRGRTYVRNGSVIDLRIEAGQVHALVSGSNLYQVDLQIKPLAQAPWAQLKGRCAHQIDSLIGLLRGSLPKSVMEIVTRKGEGLFPAPDELSLRCSCPDWASVCKHVAATLYGVGARLDHQPELLFTLRGVDPAELVEAAIEQPTAMATARRGRTLAIDDLSSVFGIDIDLGASSSTQGPAPAKRGRTAKQATPEQVAGGQPATKIVAVKVTPAQRPAEKKATTKTAQISPPTKLDEKPATKATSVKKLATKTPLAKKPATKVASVKKPATKVASVKKPATKVASVKTAATKVASAKNPATKVASLKKPTEKPALEKLTVAKKANTLKPAKSATGEASTTKKATGKRAKAAAQVSPKETKPAAKKATKVKE